MRISVPKKIGDSLIRIWFGENPWTLGPLKIIHNRHNVLERPDTCVNASRSGFCVASLFRVIAGVFDNSFVRMSSTVGATVPSAMTTVRPTGFFSLPRELRDHIYKDFLYTPSDVPATPRDTGLRFEEECPSIGAEYKILHALDPRPHAYAFPLLHSSRQIRSEVHQILSDAKTSRDLPCKLDCMLGLRNMLLTWTLFPCWPQNMRHLEIKFRPREHWSMLRHHLIFHSVLKLLNLLLSRGPQLGNPRSSRRADFHLETVTLEITSLEDVHDEAIEDVELQMLNTIELIMNVIIIVSPAKWHIDRFVCRVGKLERIKETDIWSLN